MSRAFVGDGQYDSADDEAPEIKIPIPAGSRNYVTPAGAALLANELSALETETRPRLAAEIERLGKDPAAAADALSTARRALAKTDRRIEYLYRMASIAETVEPSSAGYERVRFGASVEVEESGTGVRRSYRIVGVDEADPEAGLIGWSSPIARALTGKRPGEKALAALPDGPLGLTILSIG